MPLTRAAAQTRSSQLEDESLAEPLLPRLSKRKCCSNPMCRCNETGQTCICADPIAAERAASLETDLPPHVPRMQASFYVEDMCCACCSSGIERRLRALPGVIRVDVALMNESVMVEFDSSITSPEQIARELQDLGYPATLQQQSLSPKPRAASTRAPPAAHEATVKLMVEGMTCASCVGAVESGVKKIPGIRQVVVNLITGQVRIQHDLGITE